MASQIHLEAPGPDSSANAKLCLHWQPALWTFFYSKTARVKAQSYMQVASRARNPISFLCPCHSGVPSPSDARTQKRLQHLGETCHNNLTSVAMSLSFVREHALGLSHSHILRLRESRFFCCTQSYAVSRLWCTISSINRWSALLLPVPRMLSSALTVTYQTFREKFPCLWKIPTAEAISGQRTALKCAPVSGCSDKDLILFHICWELGRQGTTLGLVCVFTPA